MIYKSVLDQSSPTGWTGYVMPERCDIRGAEREIFTKSGLEYGRWYKIQGKEPNAYAFNILGDQTATALNSRLRKDVNALIYTHFGEDYPARKAAAIKEKGKDIYTGIRKEVIGFYREDEFDIPNGVQEPLKEQPTVTPAIAPAVPTTVATGAVQSNPVDDPGIELPSSMPTLSRLLCDGKSCSKYDFGIRTIPHAKTKPSITTTLKAYRKVVLLAVARALVARSFNMEFSLAEVKRAIRKDWTQNSQTRLYCQVMNEHRSTPMVMEVVTEMTQEVVQFINGNVGTRYSFMKEWEGNRWTLKAFLRYSWTRFKVKFKMVADKTKTGENRGENREEKLEEI